jgi:hypothetical protein
VKEEINLGQVVQGDTAHASFQIKALGGAGLKEIRVETGCGCTRAQVERESLATGESTRVDVWLDTDGRRQNMEVPIRIYAQAGATERKASIRCRAIVVPLAGLTIVPPQMSGRVKPGDHFHRSVRLSIKEVDYPLVIERTTGPEWLTVKIVPESQSAVQIELDGDIPLIGGFMSEQLHLDLRFGERVVRRSVPMILEVESLVSFERSAVVEQSPLETFETQVGFVVGQNAQVESIRVTGIDANSTGTVDGKITSKATAEGEPSVRHFLELSGQYAAAPPEGTLPGVCRGTVDVEIRLQSPPRSEVLRLPFIFIRSK